MKPEPALSEQCTRRGYSATRRSADVEDRLLSRISSPILRSAATRIVERWRAGRGEEEAAGAVHELVSLARAAQGVNGRRRTPSVPSGDADRQRRLLDSLRGAVLRAHAGKATPDGKAPAVLQVLVSLERVREVVDRNGRTGEGAVPGLSGDEELQLLAEIAHDLRSPLTSILTLAETLRREQSGAVNELQRRQLGLIYSAAFALTSIASDLIELAYRGVDLADQDPIPFSVVEILESVSDIVQPMADEKELTIRVVPPTVDHRLGFPLALGRVLLNLTTNALKFTEEGFVEVAALERTPTRIVFSVRDTGRGIPPEALKTLYQPFRPVSGEDRYAFSGTGLGLAISRRLVEAMGSTLRVETRPRWGTRFFFELGLPPATHL